MIYFDNEKQKYVLSTETIKYVHNDETVEKPIGSEGKDWWIEFEKKWEDMKIIEIKPFVPTEEQLRRFEEIKDFPEEKYSEATYYMENGKFPIIEEEKKEKETTLDDIQKTQMTTMEAIADIYMLLATIQKGIQNGKLICNTNYLWKKNN